MVFGEEGEKRETVWGMCLNSHPGSVWAVAKGAHGLRSRLDLGSNPDSLLTSCVTLENDFSLNFSILDYT